MRNRITAILYLLTLLWDIPALIVLFVAEWVSKGLQNAIDNAKDYVVDCWWEQVKETLNAIWKGEDL